MSDWQLLTVSIFQWLNDKRLPVSRCVTHGILLESTQRYTKYSANSAVGPGAFAENKDS